MPQAVILGGTSGLGLSLALQAAEHGVTPIILGRSVGKTAVRIQFPAGTEFLEIDLESEASTLEAARELRSLSGINYLFWVAGIFLRERKPVWQMDLEEINQMIAVHLNGPVGFLSRFTRERTAPYHLVTIASTSSWRLRENEAIYCMVKAGKATFTRNFARELVRDLPGSKTTLVNPGGLKTPNFWRESGQDISKFMEPDAVAKIIWREVWRQDCHYSELQIMREDNGEPRLYYGPRMPEIPE